MLEIRHLRKTYPDGWTLHDVTFSVAEREILCLLGPSGCGKSTLLRLIAGLETPDGGQILLHGTDITDLPPHRRGFGLMFQEYALFPHKDVFGNVAFGLRMQGLGRRAVAARVAEVLALVGLEGFEHRDVSQLSGGERQRVALARSLAPQPRLLMLDEPLGALDRALRERLLDELPHILRRAGVAVITVTHDQEEALALADRVVVLNGGRMMQQGPPGEVYRRPNSPWVARFLGLNNLLTARVVGPGLVETAVGWLRLPEEETAGHHGPVELLVRPEAARLGTADGAPNQLRGVVTECSFRGERYRCTVRTGDTEMTFTVPATAALPPVGAAVDFWLEPSALTVVGPPDEPPA